MFEPCDTHWTCPGVYGWELFGSHNVTFEDIIGILKEAQEDVDEQGRLIFGTEDTNAS